MAPPMDTTCIPVVVLVVDTTCIPVVVVPMDTACIEPIEPVYPFEQNVLSLAYSDSMLSKQSKGKIVYGAEHIPVPEEKPKERQVVAEWEVKPISGGRHYGWLFTVFLIQFVLIVYLRVAFIRYGEEQYRSFFNLNISQQVFRDQELSMPFPAFLLLLNGLFSYSIMLFLCLKHYHLMSLFDGLTLFWVSVFIIFAILGFKYFLMWFTSAVFPFGDDLNFYNFNFFLNVKVLGVLLLPFNLVIAYAPAAFTEMAIIVAMALVGLAYVGLAVKGLAISKNYLAFYKFHFIVYICSLEVAPVIIFAKLVMNAAR